MTDDALLNESWTTCAARCGNFVPVGRKYCCEPCANSARGDFWLEYHTAGCRDRQKTRDRREELRHEEPGAANGRS